MCFKRPWLNWDKWPLHLSEHKGCAVRMWNRIPMAISLIVCKIYKAYLNKFSFFLLWWKLEALFPNILHQTIYNPCKICVWKYFFHYHICYEYSKISSLYFLKMQYPQFHFLTKIWISIAIAQYLAHLKYQWTWVAKQTLLYNEPVKI